MAASYSIAILAGGLSSRMGSDKAFLTLGGRPLIARLASSLGPLTDDLFIAGGAAGLAESGLPLYEDRFDVRSSLTGVYSALAAARHELCFVTACDMPFVSTRLIRRMAPLAAGHDAVVPVSDRGQEPLHAFYNRSCMEPMRRGIESGNLSLREQIGRLRVRLVESRPVSPFFNINTAADLERAEALLAASAGPPLVCFVGKKNSGKTTFLERLVAILADRGARVAYLKHDVHGLAVDAAGADSWRLARAGASPAIVSAPGTVAAFTRMEREAGLAELRRLAGDVDIIVAEGFKSSGAERIEISRSARSRQLACREEDLLAVVSDYREASPRLPVFDLDDAAGVAGFLLERYGL